MTSVNAFNRQDDGGDRLVNENNKFLTKNDPVYGIDSLPPVCRIPTATAHLNKTPSHRRILSLPGGGIQGVVTLESLARIEEKTGKPICDLFDMIVGTSTGGIIALALAKNKHTGKPTLSARELQDMYVEHGEEIFSASFVRKLFSGGGLLMPKYSVSGLRNQLKSRFNELKLSDLETPIAVTAVNRMDNSLHIFRSGDEVGPHDFYLVDAALSTSAVPGGFPNHRPRSLSGKDFIFMDGGLQKNNPISLAYSEGRRLFGYDILTIASVETGSYPDVIEGKLKQHFDGLLMQPFTLIKRMLRGQGTADEQLITNMPHVSVIKINPNLDMDIDNLSKPDTRLEAAEKSNLRNLKMRAFISLRKDELDINSPFSCLFRVLNGNATNDPVYETARVYPFSGQGPHPRPEAA